MSPVEDIFIAIIVFYPIFLFSLTIHEYAHAITANWAGDMTATYQDRLTLNPIHHVDLFGSIIFPLLMISTGTGAFFGWARPVPVNEASFRDKTWNVVIAFAGPFSNFLLLVFGGFFFSFIANFYGFGVESGWWQFNSEAVQGFSTFVFMYLILNVLLMAFNLLPIPPLDGSHIFYHFFIRGNGKYYSAWDTYSRFGLFFMIAFVIFTPFFSFVLLLFRILSTIFRFPSFIGI